MTPDSALTAVIAAVNAAGLTQVRSPLGLTRAGSGRISRGFSVRPVSLSPSASPGRGKPDAQGLRIEQVFLIELGHQITPGDGAEAPNQALSDLHTVWKYVSKAATSLTTQGAIIFGQASHTYEAGGAYLITSFNLRVTYEMSLAV